MGLLGFKKNTQSTLKNHHNLVLPPSRQMGNPPTAKWKSDIKTTNLHPCGSINYAAVTRIRIFQLCGSFSQNPSIIRLVSSFNYAVDINKSAIMTARDRLNFGYETIYNSDHMIDQS
jgi:hypothetical protein